MFFLLKPKFKNVEEIIDFNEFSNEANLELFKEVFHKNHFNNPLPIGDNFNYKKFIIVATQRTGTSLLVNLLRSHSSVVCYSELLKENDRPAWGFKRIDSVTYKLSKKFPLEFFDRKTFEIIERLLNDIDPWVRRKAIMLHEIILLNQ